MPNIEDFIQRLQEDTRYSKNIVSWHQQPAREAVFADFPEGLNPAIVQLFAQRGMDKIWLHQAQAISQILAGKNVVISTGVASGKSLCYQAPILSEILRDEKSRALLIFPTKALAQDQAFKLGELCTHLLKTQKTRIKSGIYDGDTPNHERQAIRKNAQIVFSNPDMLHLGILPHHTMWSAFFSRLRYVIIDEVHYYRGVFGSHFANVLRRMQRICRLYGIRPVYICTSATLANAQEFAAALVDQDLILIDQDSSSAGPKTQLIYNPPIVEPKLGIRRSSISEAAALGKLLLKHPLQGIMFSGSRRSVEMLYLKLNESERQRVSPYRGGYLPSERREIEEKLRTGSLSLVISTNALELGIDIGALDLAIINGYPGTISALRQEAGRTGRRGNSSLAILVADSTPLDQYIALHPEYIWENNPEEALIDPNNTEILLKHLHCAVNELAFGETEDFGSIKAVELIGYLGILESEGKIRKNRDKYLGIIDTYPASEVSLRTAGLQYPILHEDECIAWVDENSAPWMTHPNAIYLHGGELWIVEKLDLEKGVVRVMPFSGDYYTQARQENEISLTKIKLVQNYDWGTKYLANVLVHSRVPSFKKLRFGNLEILGNEELSLPTRHLDTVAWYLALSHQTVESIRAKGLWNSDPVDYGADWQAISLLIRQRDGFSCVNCGSKEDKQHFHVHHIRPVRAFRNLAEANMPENLVCLCPRCHYLAEQRVRMQSGIAGVAYLLGNLAPFFVMCDPENLGRHSEIDSPLANGKPVVLLFDMVPGGIGLAKKIYQIQERILAAAIEQIQNCRCEDGCPACVGPVSENGVGAKRQSLAILECVVSR